MGILDKALPAVGKSSSSDPPPEPQEVVLAMSLCAPPEISAPAACRAAASHRTAHQRRAGGRENAIRAAFASGIITIYQVVDVTVVRQHHFAFKNGTVKIFLCGCQVGNRWSISCIKT